MENNPIDLKTRTLKKVRRQFIHRVHDSDEPEHIDPTTKHISNTTMFALKPTIGLVEINRKIYGGPSFMGFFFKTGDVTIEKLPSTDVLSLKMVMLEEENPIPWEYTRKRLESYGDLELATLAHRIDRFNKISSNLVSRCGGNDLIAKNIWSEMKSKAKKACQEIEKNPIFWKCVFDFNKDTTQMISHSYSQGLLEEMGFDLEGFRKWMAKNGMATIFDATCATYNMATKIFLDCTVFIGDSVFESPEYETFLFDLKGGKQKMMLKVVNVLEPVSDGFLSHYYFVGRKVESGGYNRSKKCITTMKSICANTSPKSTEMDDIKIENDQ